MKCMEPCYRMWKQTAHVQHDAGEGKSGKAFATLDSGLKISALINDKPFVMDANIASDNCMMFFHVFLINDHGMNV